MRRTLLVLRTLTSLLGVFALCALSLAAHGRTILGDSKVQGFRYTNLNAAVISGDNWTVEGDPEFVVTSIGNTGITEYDPAQPTIAPYCFVAFRPTTTGSRKATLRFHYTKYKKNGDGQYVPNGTGTTTVSLSGSGVRPALVSSSENPSEATEPLWCPSDEGAPEGRVDPAKGEVAVVTPDPVPTRGYPLRNNIHVTSQPLEGGRPMGIATFTYDIHVSLLSIYVSDGERETHRILCDGDGSRFDLGLSTAAPKAPRRFFSVFSDTPSGYLLEHAGPPEAIETYGNYRYLFNSQGRLTEITDPAGNRQTLTYGSSGPTQVLDVSSGRRITFSYSGSRISRITENGGFALTDLTYSNNRLTNIKVRRPDGTGGHSTQYAYVNGRLSSIQRDGDPSTYANLIYSQLATLDPSNPLDMANVQTALCTTDYKWDVPGASAGTSRVSKTNSKGGTTVYELSRSGEIVRAIPPVPSGATSASPWTFERNAQGLLTRIACGARDWRMEYDGHGLLTKRDDGVGGVTTFIYNGADPVSVTDTVGVRLKFVYDDSAQPHIPTRIVDGTNRIWRLAHNEYGQITGVTPPLGSPALPSTVTYGNIPSENSYGLPVRRDAAGLVTTIDDYNSAGDPTLVSNYPQGDAVSTALDYDAAHRLTRMTYGDGKSVAWTYAGRNQDTFVDEVGNTTRYNWGTACGLLLGVQRPLGWKISRKPDAERNIVSLTGPRGAVTKYSYGKAKELTVTEYPDGSQLRYAYNAEGQLRRILNARGASIVLDRDGAGRIVRRRFGSVDERFAYNADSTIRQVTGQEGITTYAYDKAGRLLSSTVSYPGLAAQKVATTYLVDGRPNTVAWTNGTALVARWTYVYGPHGLVSQVQNSFGETTTYSRDGEGKVVRRANANGTASTTTFNPARGWPTKMSDLRGNTAFATYNLVYDVGRNSVGNLTGVFESNGLVTRFGYDALRRLVSETRTEYGEYTSTYGYDLSGNLTTVNGTSFATYDGADKMTAVSGGTPTHDADGNLISVPSGVVSASSYLWDDLNRLKRQIIEPFTTDYGYDSSGRCVWAQQPGFTRTHYVYAGDRIVGEISNGVPSMAYTWGSDGLISQRNLFGGTSRWYHFGPQGETRNLTDSSGAVTDTYRYTAYGVPIMWGNTYNPFRYGGRVGYFTERIPELVRCGVRWYSPQLARWVSRDPIGYAGGVNLYAYVDANPVGFIDPDGTEGIPWGGGASIANAYRPDQATLNIISQVTAVNAFNAGVNKVLGSDDTKLMVSLAKIAVGTGEIRSSSGNPLAMECGVLTTLGGVSGVKQALEGGSGGLTWEDIFGFVPSPSLSQSMARGTPWERDVDNTSSTSTPVRLPILAVPTPSPSRGY